jgi:glycosyltransferase involved in cell wall biosynthesis
MRIAVAMSTFNDVDRTRRAIDSALSQTVDATIDVVVADDGSEPAAVDALAEFIGDNAHVHLLRLPHRERGWARHSAMERVLELDPDYLLFIDADMVLEPHAIQACLTALDEGKAGAAILRERPFSNSTNYVTRVKVFERTVINNATAPLGSDAIDAARFWRMDAYEQSGGLDPHQTAFEEIQPTIRYRRQGGRVVRADGLLLAHDEKHVTWQNLFGKKAEYFAAMNTTAAREEQGLVDMVRRWYPFRRVYYESDNLRAYATHPTFAAGMVAMYGGLTAVAVTNLLRERLRAGQAD